MKKIITILLTGVLVLGMLTACGNSAGKYSKYITLGQYKDVEVVVSEIPVTEADVDALCLDIYRDEISVEDKKITDRAIEMGDTANIDYVGKLDGVAFEGGTDSGYDLAIGSGSFIEGFEEGLVGVKTGETVDLDLTFPDPYHSEELAGKKVVFTVTVNYLLPGLQDMKDEVVASFGNESYSNLEELRKYAQEYIAESNQAQYESNVLNAVYNQVINNAQFKELPTDKLEVVKNTLNANYYNFASAYGMDVDTLLTYLYGMNVATFAENSVKQNILCMAIAEKEGITVSDEEVETDLAAEAELAGCTVEELLGTATKEDYKENMIVEKVLDYIVENAVVKAE